MKKLVVMAIMLFAIPAFSATALWEHDGVNTVGYTLYFWQSDAPATVYNKSIVGSTIRQMEIDDNLFAPGVEYSFQITAYNTYNESDRSNTAKWTREGFVYGPPNDNLPSILYMKPSGVDSIVIQLTK